MDVYLRPLPCLRICDKYHNQAHVLIHTCSVIIIFFFFFFFFGGGGVSQLTISTHSSLHCSLQYKAHWTALYGSRIFCEI